MQRKKVVKPFSKPQTVRVSALSKDAPQVVRINKRIAELGLATRKAADELIIRGQVFINGVSAKLGDKVTHADKVEVRTNVQKKYVYYAYNKPRGVETHSAPEGKRDIKKETDSYPQLKGVFPIGRLDKDSHGLIILTNDGRVTERLLSPAYAHEKEYKVRTKENLRSTFREKMEKGVVIEDYTTRPAKVRILGARAFSIILTEGKKHQIRRMVAALFNSVASLERVRVMNIQLGTLEPGSHRKIEGAELKEFLRLLGLVQDTHA